MAGNAKVPFTLTKPFKTVDPDVEPTYTDPVAPAPFPILTDPVRLVFVAIFNDPEVMASQRFNPDVVELIELL